MRQPRPWPIGADHLDCHRPCRYFPRARPILCLACIFGTLAARSRQCAFRPLRAFESALREPRVEVLQLLIDRLFGQSEPILSASFMLISRPALTTFKSLRLCVSALGFGSP